MIAGCNCRLRGATEFVGVPLNPQSEQRYGSSFTCGTWMVSYLRSVYDTNTQIHIPLTIISSGSDFNDLKIQNAFLSPNKAFYGTPLFPLNPYFHSRKRGHTNYVCMFSMYVHSIVVGGW